VLSSKDNPKVRHWQRLAEDGRYRRTKKRALIEGPHLLAAALDQGHKPIALLATEEGMANSEIGHLVQRAGAEPVLLSRGVFRRIVDADNPPGVAAEIAIPPAKEPGGNAVFLEGIQDPANVGAILRSAAAFGVTTVMLDRACADPWAPKALRAGMGGHFALVIREAADLRAEVAAYKGTTVCTVPRGGTPLAEAKLNGDVAWLFGAEGRGLSEEAMRAARMRVSIPMSAGTESLNVAAAAAICLYATFKGS
jgi:TrmH family RNA methyltransferase